MDAHCQRRRVRSRRGISLSTATDSKPGTGFELKESRCADDSRIESEDDCKEAAANSGSDGGGLHTRKLPTWAISATRTSSATGTQVCLPRTDASLPSVDGVSARLRPPGIQRPHWPYTPNSPGITTYAYFNDQAGWPYTPGRNNHKGELCYGDPGSTATDSKATHPGTSYDGTGYDFTWEGTHDVNAAGLFLHGQYSAADDAQKRVLCAQYCIENGYEPGWISFADNDCCGRGECPCTSETMVPGTASADRQCGCVAKGTDCSVAANQRPLLAARIYKVHERLCGEQHRGTTGSMRPGCTRGRRGPT